MVAVFVGVRYDEDVDWVIFCFPLGVIVVFLVFGNCAVCAVFVVVVVAAVVVVVVVFVVVVVVVVIVVVVVVVAVVVVVMDVVVFIIVDVVVVVIIVVSSVVVDIFGDSLKIVKVLGIFLNLTFSSVAFSFSTIFFLSPTVSFFMLTLNQGCGLPERFGSFLLGESFSILWLLSEASLTCSEKVSFSLVPGM